jgi:ferritin-like metal-binding protein YciE
MASLATLQDLFVHELRDMYDGEKQISKALPKLAKASSTRELRSAFEEHQTQTLQHIDRLEEVFEQFDTRARGTRCHGIAGIVEEGSAYLDGDGDESVIDASLIAAAQKVEHYEIAAYGTLAAYARTLGRDEAAELLERNLEEEKAADRKLTQLAETMINALAAESVHSS